MDTKGNGALLFLGGAALGALAVYALTKSNPGVKPFLADAVAGGLNLKDKFMGVVGQARENLEDLVAEAEHARKAKAGEPSGGAESQGA